MTSLTGRTLGDFTLLDKIGEGGHGVVYRAEQRGLGREAVIKVQHARGDTSVQRFLREAQLASRLDHPYAAHVYAFGAEPDGLLWIAMELVRGTTLADVLAAQPTGRLPVTRVVSLLDGLCEVVHTAHEQGIVHRDLKPDNIMVLSRAGRLMPKLLDLGVAKQVSDASDSEPVGSPSYMAPEQWRTGGEIDARTDVYALGVVVYEMLAGKLPFSAHSVADLARAHLRDDPPPLPSDLADGVDAAVRRALAKSADDRYPTALAFGEAVRAAAGLRLSADALPRLDDSLRAEIAWLPQPIADAVATLEAARNPHQARDALWQVVDVIARWLGILTLAARTRTGARTPDAPAVVAALRELHRNELTAEAWFELVRGLVAPFAALRDAYPIPELVDLAAATPSPMSALSALRGDETATTSEESLRDWLARSLPALAPLLGAVTFLASYQLVVPDGTRGEIWMGTRRQARPVIAIAAGLVGATIVDFDGNPILALAPLVQLASPSPGAARELFVFAGAGRVRGHGARLVSQPHGFERHDDVVWTWFRSELLAVDDAETAAVEDAPYPGLATFTEADAGRFFGRERASEAFVNQLRVQPMLAVVGPSGTGKSSFVRAGVIPALPPGWRAIVFRPGARPLARMPEITAEPTVIVVDQFEELFTSCRDPDERDRFASALAAACADDHVRVVLTIRDDFLARASELAPLRDRIANAITLLATPDDDDLLRVIVEPARRAGYDFDNGLPQRMVRSVRGHAGALALLSFTALELWSLRDRHFKRLGNNAYDAIGGVEGALAQHAEATLVAMTKDDQRVVRDAFRNLVTAEGTRAMMTRAELDGVLGPRAGAVIERLVAARLLVTTDDDRVEIVHEALLSAWPRLVDWRREDVDGARLRDQLRAAARQWDERDKPRGLLWRGDALDDYVRWRARRLDALPAIDQAFADASVRDARRGRRIRGGLAITAATTLVGGVIALTLLYRASEDNAGTARDRLIVSQVKQGQHYLFDGDYMRALPFLAAAYDGGDRSLALRLMLHRALQLADAPVTPHDGGLTDPVFRRGGREIIVGGRDDAIVIDAATGAVTSRLAPEPGTPAMSSGDGVAFALRGSAVIAWDGLTTRPITNGLALDPKTTRLAVDRHSARLAIASGTQLSVWDIRTAARAWTAELATPARQVRWLGDAVVVATEHDAMDVVGHDSKRTLAQTSKLQRPLVTTTSGVAIVAENQVTFLDATGAVTLDVAVPGATAVAMAGDLYAVGSMSGTITLYTPSSPGPIGFLAGHTSRIQQLAFTPDRTRVVSTADDHTVRIWHVPTRHEQLRYVGLTSSPTGLALSADGTRIAVATADDVRTYSLDDPAIAISIDAGERVGASQFVAAGTRIFTTSETGVELWDARTGARLARIDVAVYDSAHANRDATLVAIPIEDTPTAEIRDLPSGAVRATLRSTSDIRTAVFSPDGARVVTGNDDGVIEVWDLGGRRVGTLRGHTKVVEAVAVSPDGTRLVSGANDTSVRLWDLASGRELAPPRLHADEVLDVAFDATGTRIISGSSDRSVTLSDARTLVPIRTFSQLTPVQAVAIDEAGTLVASATSSGMVQVWDIATGREAARMSHGGIASSVEFSRDRLLTTSRDHRVLVWNLETRLAPPQTVEAFLRCHVGYELRDGELVPRDATGCAL